MAHKVVELVALDKSYKWSGVSDLQRKLKKYIGGEKGEIYLLSCFFILSFIVTYFYFYKGYFKVGFDDIVHFQVFESITNAFENHRLPPLVNHLMECTHG